jgi:predicted nucleic acid-binding protein
MCRAKARRYRLRIVGMKTYVLDASALVAFFEDRAGAEKVEELLARAAEAKRPLLMSVVSWGEVYYSVWRAVAGRHGDSSSPGSGTAGEPAAEAIARRIAQLPIQIVDADLQLTALAASLKAQHQLPYAACFAAALAQSRQAALVTADRDFSEAEKSLKMVWVS